MTEKEIVLKTLKELHKKKISHEGFGCNFTEKGLHYIICFFVNFTKFCTCERLWVAVSGYVITRSKIGTRWAAKKMKNMDNLIFFRKTQYYHSFIFPHFIIFNSNLHLLSFIPCYEKTVLIIIFISKYSRVPNNCTGPFNRAEGG